MTGRSSRFPRRRRRVPAAPDTGPDNNGPGNTLGDGPDDGIAYEPDDRIPLGLTLGMGLQGVVLTLTTTALAMSLFVSAAGFDDDERSWSIVAAVVINGVATAAQSARLGPVGGGHNLMVGSAPSFIAVALLALDKAGPDTLAALIVASSLMQLALARWLPRSRQIITPTVGGVAVMLIAVSVMQVAVGRLSDASADGSSFSGPAVAAITVAVAAVLGLRAKGLLRLWSPLVGIVTACCVAALFGLYDDSGVRDAAWIAAPNPQPPGLDLTPGPEFWSLLPMFLVVSMSGTLNAMTSSLVVQGASWRKPRAPDYRLVQGAMHAHGLGTMLCGFAGTLPTATFGAATVAMTSFTGVASRRVGYGVGAILVALALLPKAMALLVTVPAAVAAGYLLVITGMLFVEGLRTAVGGGLQRHKAMIVGVSMGVGVGLQGQDVVAELIGGAWGTLLGDGLMLGTLTAILLTAFVEATGRRRKRLEVELHMDELPRVDSFLESMASGLRWSESSAQRLRLVGEEALSSLLDARGSDEQRSRLVVVARPAADLIELQFLAALEDQNLEDRLAYLSEQTDVPEERTISLQLLRHYASTVRHRKYHGIDIVTVEVERAPQRG